MLAVEWTPPASLLGICSQKKLAVESSRITNGPRRHYWGHYFSPAETVHSEIIQPKVYCSTVTKLVFYTS